MLLSPRYYYGPTSVVGPPREYQYVRALLCHLSSNMIIQIQMQIHVHLKQYGDNTRQAFKVLGLYNSHLVNCRLVGFTTPFLASLSLWNPVQLQRANLKCAVCNSNLNWKLPFSFFFFFGLSAAERLTFESVTSLILLFLHAQHGNKELTLSAKVLNLSCQLCSDKNESPRLLIQNLKRPGASLQRGALLQDLPSTSFCRQ